jgi:ER-bound oxygenase mpaB/B'/Rubber oxygenase, catalytic domain
MFIGGSHGVAAAAAAAVVASAGDGGGGSHSGYRGDPWGRLQRTSYFLAVATFGRASDARDAVARVQAIHQRITGTAPDRQPYAAPDRPSRRSGRTRTRPCPSARAGAFCFTPRTYGGRAHIFTLNLKEYPQVTGHQDGQELRAETAPIS